MAQNKKTLNAHCPKCNSRLYRIRRRFSDRIISWIVAVQRYYCHYCEWEGLYPAKKLRVPK